MSSIRTLFKMGILGRNLRKAALILVAAVLIAGEMGSAGVSSTFASSLFRPPASVNEWGTFGTGDGEFKSPYGVAVDGNGYVYVADLNNDRVQKFTSDGEFMLKWGSPGSGAGEFNGPTRVAVDHQGNVFVVDFSNHRIQKFDSNGNFLLSWGNRGRNTSEFYFPSGIAIDEDGNIYIADLYNRRIQKFDSNGAFLLKWGTMGKKDGQFNLPVDVGVDKDGDVYVIDRQNNSVQKFNSNGNFLLKWGSSGSADGEFGYSTGIEVDDFGDVYVADSSNHRIQKFDNEGNFILKWGEYGTGEDQFDAPVEVAVTQHGNVFVADVMLNRIQTFDFFVDVIPPTLSMAADAVVEATGPGGAVHNFVVTATDNYDPAPIVLCSPPSGSTFPLGANSVTCTATDFTGNFSVGTFNVTVQDTTPPSIVLPADIVVEGDTEGGAILDLPEVAASDLVDPDPVVSCDYNSDFFPLGVTNVACEAEDFSGNHASASFQVTVVDTTPPTISAPANIELITNTPGGAIVELGEASSSDIVDPSPVITNNAPDVFPMDTTIVTWTATDSSGNTATATQSVTVNPIPVGIDIKPGTDPNVNNCSNDHAKLTVSILSSGEFDATAIDHETVIFEGVYEIHGNRDTGELTRHEEDVNGDGSLDLVFHFDVAATSLTCESVEGTLTGMTFDGFHFVGVDSIDMFEPGNK